MPRYEYKVVPAPTKPGKIKGVKGVVNRFAAELAGLMNQYGADGWEYQRTDTLPCEARKGLTGRVTEFQNMLVFRREINPVETVVPAPAEADPMPALPSLRATAPAPAPAPVLATTTPPEGEAPPVGAATHPRPDIAAQ